MARVQLEYQFMIDPSRGPTSTIISFSVDESHQTDFLPHVQPKEEDHEDAEHGASEESRHDAPVTPVEKPIS